jgi:acetolactate synthase-1/2/3 large subunit
MGGYGHPTANAYLSEADLVIVLGSRLGVSDTGVAHPALINPTRQALVQVDIDPRNVGWTFPVEHPLVGDAPTVIRQLLEALPATLPDRSAELVAALREQLGYFDDESYTSDDQPIAPQRVMGELMRALPDDSVVTCDAGANRLWTTRFYQTPVAGGYLHNGTGSMGYAIPSAMVAKLLHPERPVVAVCGDGGFAMTMNALFTAREEGLGIVVVVLNNNRFAHSLHGTGVDLGTKLGDFDHAAIARGMGCHGVRVTDPADLGAALSGALGQRLPAVIDVVVSGDAKFSDLGPSIVSREQATAVSAYSA